ncbi:MAG: PDZ domain-containing protein [Gemmatimonas sp.]|nr:PDZ domain-containing protein [Gemmatimonas sp.]
MDEHLIELAKRGEGEAVGRLYERHAPRVYAVVRRLCGNDAEAEDLARLVDEEAAPNEREHLEVCDRCAAELEALREQTRSLAVLSDPSPPPGVRMAIEEELRRERDGRAVARRAVRHRAMRIAEGKQMTNAIRTVVLAMLAATVVAAGTAEAQRRGDSPEALARASRGWLGFSFRVDDSGAVTVTEVRDGTPADGAGLRDGDTIVRWDGRQDVVAAIAGASLDVGDTVELRVRHEGETDRDVTLEAERRPWQVVFRTSDMDQVIAVDVDKLSHRLELMRDSFAVHADSLLARMGILLADSLGPRMRVFDREIRSRAMVADSLFDGLTVELSMRRSGIAGAELTEISPGLASYFEVSEGILVLRVAPDTPAARAGLEEGDVIVSAGGEAVNGIEDVRRAFRTSSAVEIEIVRRGNRYTLQVDG